MDLLDHYKSVKERINQQGDKYVERNKPPEPERITVHVGDRQITAPKPKGVKDIYGTRDDVLRVLVKYEMEYEDLLGKVKIQRYVDARAELSRILRRRGLSYPQIGKVINRDHTSIIHLVRKYGNGS